MSKENGGSAFPSKGVIGYVKHSHTTYYGDNRGEEVIGDLPGMTLRAYAAIKLKVPDSGLPWLDDMIRKARRDEDAAKAMQGFLGKASESEEQIAKDAYLLADAMLKAREK